MSGSRAPGTSAVGPADPRRRVPALPREHEIHVWWIGHAPAPRIDVSRRVRQARRSLAAGYLRCDVSELHFTQSDRGKPALLGRGADLRFSVAHGVGVSALTFASGHDVGIDVEAVRSDVDVLEVARTHFDPRDAERLRGLGEADRAAAFFVSWVRREAVLKCVGTGVGSDLARVTFHGPDDSRAVHGRFAPVSAPLPDGRAADDVVATDIEAPTGHRAALAVRGGARPWDVVVRRPFEPADDWTWAPGLSARSPAPLRAC